MSRPTQLPNLDGLRAIAVMSVLGVHMGFPRGGWVGVDLFFALSGFLITLLLRREIEQIETISFRAFYWRRALRLLPAMVCAALLTVALWTTNESQHDPRADVGPALASGVFYFANFMPSYSLGSFSAWWSLSVEEHFYFLWPVAFLWLARKPQARQITVIVIVIGAVCLLRAVLFESGYDLDALYMATFTRCDSLLAGAAAAVLYDRVTNRRAWLTVGAIVYVVLLFSIDRRSSALFLGGYTLASVIFAGGIAAAARSGPFWLLNNSAMVWVGRRSYGIYLYHIALFNAAHSVIGTVDSPAKSAALKAVQVGTTLVVAALSYRFIEQPFLRMKKQPQQRLRDPANIVVQSPVNSSHPG